MSNHTPKKIPSTPQYRRHKASGRAVVTLQGKDHYLGAFGSKSSRIEYDRLLSEWLANGRMLPPAETGDVLTIAKLILRYWSFGKSYYKKDGKPTGQLTVIKAALRLLRRYYERIPAVDFGPLALQALQSRMIESGLSRSYINGHTGRIKLMFKWAVSQQMLPVTVYQALATVSGLRKGRTAAREPDPIMPVADDVREATLPFLPPIVADMVKLQRVTGSRPGEICLLRPSDVERGSEIWCYRPSSHKTQHHGRDRRIYIGPRGQVILSPYLLRPSDSFCFSPAEGDQERKEQKRALRKTPVQPSQRDRSKAKPRRKPGQRYTTKSYFYAVRRGCQKAGVPLWSPNQLRHSAATEVSHRFGLVAAATVLGHSKPDTTLLYAERDYSLAEKIMKDIG